MTSEAIADPPGLSMRTTMARIDGIHAHLAQPLARTSPTRRPAAGTVERALAAGNRARGVQQRDAGAALARPPARGRLRVGRRPRAGACPAIGRLVVELILVGERVDEPAALRALGQVRPAVDSRRAASAGSSFRPVADGAHELVVPVPVERGRHLAMRRGERLLGEGVRRRLVVADVQQVGVRRRSCRACRGRTARRSPGRRDRAGRPAS